MATEVPNWVYGTRSSFSAGELTPTIEGRADLPLYQNGAKKIINWMILPSGGVTRRPGTEFIWAKALVPERPISGTLASEAHITEPGSISISDTSVSDTGSISEDGSLEDIGVMPTPDLSVPDSSVPTASGGFFDYGILDKEDEIYGRNTGLPSLDAMKRKPRKAVKREIGRRAIPGWTLQDVEDNGNCFYDAVAHQMGLLDHGFLHTVPEGTLPRDSLRLFIQGEDFKDEEWAEDTTFDGFVKKIDAILAIIDTRTPENGYVYYYLGNDGDVITRVRDADIPLPEKPTIRLAATGDHFLSVVSEEAEGERQ